MNIIKITKLRKSQLIERSEKVKYKKLKLRIREIFETQEAFAKAMGMNYTTLNFRLNGKVEWKSSEIVKACKLLMIPLHEAHLYFFI